MMKRLTIITAILLTGCATVEPKPQFEKINCAAEQLYDFSVTNGSKNYWNSMVTDESLHSCREHDYQPHLVEVVNHGE